MSETTSVVPNQHDQKYDRQLRLWGGHGQKLLEESKVLLLGGTAAGTETLKNLILPGLGSFTIVDDQKVVNADLGRNFFVELGDVGKSRAQVTKTHLAELNPDCKDHHAIEKKIDELDADFFSSFSLVIASGASEDNIIKVSKICWDRNIPFVVVDVYGFFGYIRLQDKEHTVIESHPEFSRSDLRISSPFPEFVSFADTFDLDKLGSYEHSHLPFPVILYKAISLWKQKHDGKVPSTSKEKDEFKRFVSTLSRSCLLYTSPSPRDS
eukprot:TRINITY_DN2876_c0_g1_i3.p1 TRINITY_DN2876_c0_g1~~TRINITY_DN2876_c0_g1_i3.p1  ORF type:complete len:267 (+),score=46.41 TRINITY_DN2876_c0_g1_i3:55-855(+)